MKTNTRTPDEGTDPAKPSPTTLFAAFSEPRRQCALEYLAHKPGAVPLGDVAEYVSVTEGVPTRDRYERVLVSLYHAHVPHLADAELVRYDEDGETIELLVDPDVLGPYVRLASDSKPA